MLCIGSPCLRSAPNDSDDETEGSNAPEPPSVLASNSARMESMHILERLETSARDQLYIAARDTATVNIGASRGFGIQQLFQRRQSLCGEDEGSLSWTESRKVLEAAIAVEHRTDHASWDERRTSIVLEEDRLLRRLDRLGLQMVLQLGDGNCQFRSLSWGIYGTPKYYKRVRRSAVDHMVLNRKEYELFLGEDFQAYAKSMKQDGVWGDELTLRAACQSYGVVINVITSDAQGWFTRYIPTLQQIEREIFLAYIAPMHYNAIRRQRKGTKILGRSLSSFRRRNKSIMSSVERHAQAGIMPETPAAVMEGHAP